MGCNAKYPKSWIVNIAAQMISIRAFPGGRATLVETAPSVTVENVIANTEAELVVPETVPQMSL